MYYAYLHCKPDGVPFYVGKGNDRRVASIPRKNKFHCDVLKKYGVEKIKVVKFEFDSEELAFEMEIRLISILRNLGVKLANQTDGGEGASGWVAPPEYKEKRSAANRGENNPFFGKKHSPEQLRSMSERARKQWEDPALRAMHSERGRRAVGEANPFFGRRHSEEMKRQMSELKTGRPGRKMTEEMRKDCSSRVTGERHHFYGKKLSDEHRAKMSSGMRESALGARFMLDSDGRRRRVLRGKVAERVEQGWLFVSQKGES